MKLKHPQGWFAAGREVTRAIEVLSDAAFKLYIYFCLHAERNTGRLDLVETNMTRALGKSPQLIQGCIEEMEQQGICRRWRAAKGQGVDQIEVCDDFWPYEKDPLRARSVHETQYLERIRQLLIGHRCMAIAFTPADRKLAFEFYQKGVPLENVRRAILLGCTRKCTTLLSTHVAEPITSLHYFRGIVEEVGQLQVSADYWRYLELSLNRMEAELPEKNGQPQTK
jgi:hypothetical protein